MGCLCKLLPVKVAFREEKKKKGEGGGGQRGDGGGSASTPRLTFTGQIFLLVQ